MERKPKTIFQLDSPFTRSQVPEISPEHQNTIIDILCSVLSPIGQYRLSHVPASKGKRSKKRKRQDANLKGETPVIVRPPLPEISSFLVIGLSSITRNLEDLSRKSKPTTIIYESTNQKDTSKEDQTLVSSIKLERKACESHFSAIFVLSQSLPSVLQDHLPQLVATASLAYPTLPATRLVQLPKSCEGRICSALGLQRASVVGILDGAPHTQHLMDLVREHVPEVQIRWLDEVKKLDYLPVKIKAIETFGWVAEKEPQES